MKREKKRLKSHSWCNWIARAHTHTHTCTRTHTHTRTCTPPSAISLSLLWGQHPRVCKAPQQREPAGGRVTEAATTRSDLTKLPPGQGRQGQQLPSEDPPGRGWSSADRHWCIHHKDLPGAASAGRESQAEDSQCLRLKARGPAPGTGNKKELTQNGWYVLLGQSQASGSYRGRAPPCSFRGWR